ncbi:monovalent cation:proton antiporter-2 (CPA2) family protein [Rodentibacter pneumotropicus]|uniref:Potassium transporter n=1 Tax=Rodentibacter pneumotropicus TaxID=758 RepID=A0A4V3SQD1_9PAST|nr:monovalent cation:proton antiporter-2 (CPA2) family protein [Rodentibacter pneumotropicus]OOF64611.1 potassium transporter [Rodentibacter pneumotropicus]THA02036.1 potassium transporter [Rodentibacter pneumotropicus]THA02500.1 potassium transporter [Rodentibacter pneumotropicus]THA06866.1 potassium transporter [Rodentibacter pneumotropicus]THA17080.1 potassium transporter [Rodentibacter pneumotropicus]
MVAEGASDLIRVVALLGAAVIAVPLFKRIGLGSVLGYLAAGLAIGPYGLHLIADPHAIIHLAEFGVVMFLFVIGLEMKPSHLWSLRRQIFGLGSMQVIISAILMTIVGTQFGVSWEVAFVSSAGFVLTSTAIVMQVLGERKELSTKRGQKIVSILLFEDLLIVPLLAVVTFLSPFEKTEASMPWWQSAGIAMLALAALVFIGRFILNPVFRILANAKAREVMTAAALFVVLGAALLMEEAGLSMAMGAFVAGVMLSESAFRHQLEADIEPFRGLLLGLFFLGVGMALDLKVVAENWQLILLGVIVLMLTKGICIYLVARMAKSTHKTALERALLMAQGGEFAFVLFAAALSKGVIDETVNANMTAIVVLSMVMTPIILVLYEKYGAKEIAEEIQPDEIDEQHPILIIGMGRFGQIVNDLLRLSGYATTIVDLNPNMIKGFNEYGIKSYFGDASRREFLIAAGLEQAEMLVVAIDNKEQASAIVHFAREVNPNIKIIARSYDRFHTFDLYNSGANEVVRETFDSAVRTGRLALERLGMEPEVAKEIAEYYFHGDRHEVRLMSQVYEPKSEFFKSPVLQDIARECDQKMATDIQEILLRAKEKEQEEN